MRKFRRTAAAALAAMMAFSATGCGSSATETKATEAAKDDTAAAGSEADKVSEAVTEAANKEGKKLEDMTVGVFYYTYSDTYISSVRTALDESLKTAVIDFQDYDANSNQTTQNEQIDTAISTGANLLIVNIVTSGSVDASQAIVDKAQAAGIPVIFFNRAVESDEEEGKVLGSYDKAHS